MDREQTTARAELQSKSDEDWVCYYQDKKTCGSYAKIGRLPEEDVQIQQTTFR